MERWNFISIKFGFLYNVLIMSLEGFREMGLSGLYGLNEILKKTESESEYSKKKDMITFHPVYGLLVN